MTEAEKIPEKFMRIKNFEEFYVISNYGRVVSLHKKNKFLELKRYKQHNDYLVVHLKINGIRLKRRVHRLVALHFIKNDDPVIKSDVHHKDSNKNNNYFENLEWCSHHKNMEWFHH